MPRPLPFDSTQALHDHDFRATDLRVAILEALASALKPTTAPQLSKKLRRMGADTATIYRALDAYVSAGLVRKLALFDEIASYELIREGTRTYHIVCEYCHAVERIPLSFRTIESSAKEKSRLFKTIADHKLSLVGTCKKCARAVR